MVWMSGHCIYGHIIKYFVNFAETCKADFTCYIKECASKNGPQALLEGLKDTPNTPAFAAVRLIYEQQLENLKCPYISIDHDIGMGQKRYCCPDMITKDTESK